MDKKIIEYIIKKQKATFIDIVKDLKIKPNHNKEVTSILGKLQKEYAITKNRDDSFSYMEFVKDYQGTFYVNNSGNFAFVEKAEDKDLPIEEKESYYVSKFNFNFALNGDLVNIKVFKDSSKQGTAAFYAVVTDILERKNDQVIGFLKKNKTFIDFFPIDKRFSSQKFKIVNVKTEAKINDLVVAKIVGYDKVRILVDIVKVITNETDPKVFLKAFIEEVKLPQGFPQTLEQEIAQIPLTIEDKVNLADRAQRRDLRNELIFTIDGESTKDFDDAISIKKLENGNYKLGVHIADVSYYVQEDTLIDQEALERGTSIYLADRVVPMLPEALSNGICSLNPNVDRYALSCEMEIDKNGNNISIDIFPSIINSKFRLTYKQVNLFLEAENQELSDAVDKSHELRRDLNLSYELSRIIHKFKENEGYIDFEIKEPKIVLNEDGSVADIKIEERGKSEVLIEDFMVRANETVAKFLSEKGFPVMYRVHDAPDEEKIHNFKTVLNALDVNIQVSAEGLSPVKFAQVVRDVKKQRNDEFINLIFLRTMQKAKYSPYNVGHFGLASENYCHFTSPIRRYPDLMVHRVIRDLVFDKKIDKKDNFEEKMDKISNQNSTSEQSAVEIERKSNDLMYAEYFSKKIGTKMKAQIISVLKFGFFVEFENKTDALVHKTTLFDGEYEANETGTVFYSSSRKFKIGDAVDVTIVGTDLVEGKIDAVLTEFIDQYNAQKNNSYRNVNDKQIRKS
ncbi:ribonuclease R [Mycoplasma sp. Ms02]|uniref:ribonuclease R n=1 Tax=Mycoplasma sp. Ms02 TaxID=353851 RepID=UPI001C89A41E|nr:ribonuclease R [Mycoplasma sp. Ms02]QZE12279.1 ribonuclease R [Mycoplasma sp. Ms02]